MKRTEIESNYKLLQREREIQNELDMLKKYIQRIEERPDTKRFPFFLSRFDAVTRNSMEELLVNRNTLLTMLKQMILDLQGQQLSIEKQIEKL